MAPTKKYIPLQQLAEFHQLVDLQPQGQAGPDAFFPVVGNCPARTIKKYNEIVRCFNQVFCDNNTRNLYRIIKINRP